MKANEKGPPHKSDALSAVVMILRIPLVFLLCHKSCRLFKMITTFSAAIVPLAVTVCISMLIS